MRKKGWKGGGNGDTIEAKPPEGGDGMRILTWAACAFAVACGAYCLGFSGTVSLLCGAALLLCGAVCLFFRRKKAVACAAVLLIGLGAGLMYCRGFDCIVMEPAGDRHGTVGTTQAYVADFPAATDYGWQFHAREADTGQRIAVYGESGPVPELLPGDRVELTGEYRLADRFGGEKTLRYYADGVYLRLYLTKHAPTGTAQTTTFSMCQWALPITLEIPNLHSGVLT